MAAFEKVALPLTRELLVGDSSSRIDQALVPLATSSSDARNATPHPLNRTIIRARPTNNGVTEPTALTCVTLPLGIDLLSVSFSTGGRSTMCPTVSVTVERGDLLVKRTKGSQSSTSRSTQIYLTSSSTGIITCS